MKLIDVVALTELCADNGSHYRVTSLLPSSINNNCKKKPVLRWQSTAYHVISDNYINSCIFGSDCHPRYNSLSVDLMLDTGTWSIVCCWPLSVVVKLMIVITMATSGLTLLVLSLPSCSEGKLLCFFLSFKCRSSFCISTRHVKWFHCKDYAIGLGILQALESDGKSRDLTLNFQGWNRVWVLKSH